MLEGDPDPRLNEELTRAVRRWGRPTTPEELSARGVARVHAVSLSRVAALIEKAVNRTLIRRTLDGAPDDALSLSSAAREEFVRLAQRAQGAGGADAAEARDTTRLAQRATSTIDRLRTELARRRAALALEAKAPHAVHDLRESALVIERLRELFARFGGPREVPRELERQVLDVVREAFDDVVHREVEARRREHQREIDLLERRLTKLQALLGETEAELARSRAHGALEPGVASQFTSVQGLDTSDPLRERKESLMGAIFAANLALRRS